MQIFICNLLSLFVQVGLPVLETRSRLQRTRQERQRPHNHRRGQRKRRHRHSVSACVKRNSAIWRRQTPFSLRPLTFQAEDCQDEQRDAGDGRSLRPIRSASSGAGMRGGGGWGERWAGSRPEENPGQNESNKRLGFRRGGTISRAEIRP